MVQCCKCHWFSMEFTPKNRHLLTCQTWEPSKECLTHSCRPRPLSRPLSVVLQKPTVIATSIWMKVKLIIASFVVECDSWMFVYCMSHVDYDIHIYNYIIYIYVQLFDDARWLETHTFLTKFHRIQNDGLAPTYYWMISPHGTGILPFWASLVWFFKSLRAPRLNKTS